MAIRIKVAPTGWGVAYPRVVDGQMVTTEEVTKRVQNATSLTRGDVRAALAALHDVLAEALRNGESVKLDDIGVFSIATRFKPGTADKQKYSARDVELSGIHFLADTRLKNALAEARFEMQGSHEKTETVAADARRAALDRLLGTGREFDTCRYAEEAGISQSAAYKQMKKYVSQGLVVLRRVGINRLYSAPA